MKDIRYYTTSPMAKALAEKYGSRFENMNHAQACSELAEVVDLEYHHPGSQTGLIEAIAAKLSAMGTKTASVGQHNG